MHNAPPVDYPVGRFSWGPRVSFLLAALAALGLITWGVLSVQSVTLVAVAMVFWLASVMAAKWFVNREFLHDGHFVWDGEAWYRRDAQQQDCPVQVQVLVDAGRAMLLACHAPIASVGEGHGRQFAWLQQSNMPLSWHGFRCAVYSRPMGDARPDSGAASLLEI